MPNQITGANVLQNIEATAKNQIIAWGMVVDSNGGQTDPSGAPQPGEVSGWPDAYSHALADWLGNAGSGVAFTPPGKQGFGPGGFGLTKTYTVDAAHQQYIFPQTIKAGDGITDVNPGFGQSGIGGVIYVPSGTNVGGIGGEQKWLGSINASDTNHHYVSDVNDSCILHFRHASFETGSGSQSFWPSIRQAGLNWYFKASANTPTVTGTDGLLDTEFIITGGSGRVSSTIEGNILTEKDLVGPFLLLNVQRIHPTATNGVTVSVLNYQGGLGGVEAASAVLAASDAALAEELRTHCYPQIRRGQSPYYVIQWMHGGNDRNDFGQASWNPDTFVRNGVQSSDPAGVYNNCLTYYRRILDIWTRVLGYNPNRLKMVIGPYMEQPSFVSTLASYETALVGIHTLYPTNVCVLPGTMIFSSDVWDDMNWFKGDSGGGGEDTDTAHQIRQGYYAGAYMAVSTMRTAAQSIKRFSVSRNLYIR